MSLALAALSLIAPCGGCQSNSSSSGARSAPPPESSVRDPSVLVVVHSFSGHTATVGRELAQMLGGAFVRVADPPPIPDIAPGAGPWAKEILPAIRMDGVRWLFVGFPIYDEKPSPIADEIIRVLPLQGVRVTPFFTFIHYFETAALDAFAREIANRGAVPTAAMAFRLPALVSEEGIVARTRATLLERRDLWSPEGEPPPVVHCEDAGPPHAARLCSVPGGIVWLGDVSTQSSLGPGLPPRLERVEAFDLDEKEISIAQYGRCVAAHRCREHRPHGASAELERDGDDLPMPDLSWSDAAEYCAFAGLRLPTEPEWVRAARGSSLTPYPWGDALPGLPPARANLGEKPANGLPHYSLADPESAWVGDGYAGLAPGCRFPLGRGPFGHCDLVGNLLEWVDAPVPTAKGGSWIDVEPRYVTVAARATIEQRNLGSFITGARCARSR